VRLGAYSSGKTFTAEDTEHAGQAHNEKIGVAAEI
jgi:hypothetical protein